MTSKNSGWAIAVLAAALAWAAPQAAQASDKTVWQSCVGPRALPEQRVSACTGVIEAGTETGHRLAAAYCNRGHGLTEQRQLELALNDLDEALKLDPDYPCAYSNRGRVYAFKRDPDRAIADYDQALKLDPNFALAYNNRAMAWLDKNEPGRAIADLSAAIKADPKLAIAYGNRGYIYYRQRDWPRDRWRAARLAPARRRAAPWRPGEEDDQQCSAVQHEDLAG